MHAFVCGINIKLEIIQSIFFKFSKQPYRFEVYFELFTAQHVASTETPIH